VFQLVRAAAIIITNIMYSYNPTDLRPWVTQNLASFKPNERIYWPLAIEQIVGVDTKTLLEALSLDHDVEAFHALYNDVNGTRKVMEKPYLVSLYIYAYIYMRISTCK
jgi:hypothetical protein